MRASGSLAKQTVTASCTMLMATSTRATGLTIRQMVRVLTPMQTGQSMSDNGKMINNMVLG